MVSILIEGDNLIIKVMGHHKIWAFKKQIVLDIRYIKSAQIADKALHPTGIRCPGTYVPKVIYAGTFLSNKQREFWDTTLKGNALEINLEGTRRYARLVVDVEHPSETLSMIQNAILR